MRMIQILQHIHQKENQEFITELYRDLLNREPDPIGLETHHQLLRHGMTKMNVTASLLKSREARNLYTSPFHWPLDNNKPTVANILHNIFKLNNSDFIKALYLQILCREPDENGYSFYMFSLNKRTPRISVLISILTSEEALSLLKSTEENVIAERILLHKLNKPLLR